jgi:hypothetical protein
MKLQFKKQQYQISTGFKNKDIVVNILEHIQKVQQQQNLNIHHALINRERYG